MTFLAATKTFNLAGLGGSLAVIPDARLRSLFRTALQVQWSELGNPFSAIASETAWRRCGGWLDEMLAYVAGNYAFLAARLPSAVVYPLEGTYLVWMDLRGLGLPDDQVTARLLDGAKVWLDDGAKFGVQGKGFRRLNLACPRSVLKTALERMAAALRH